MSLRNMVIVAIVAFVVMIAVVEWFLCLALSRNKRKRPEDEDGQQEEFLRRWNRERGKSQTDTLERRDDTDIRH